MSHDPGEVRVLVAGVGVDVDGWVWVGGCAWVWVRVSQFFWQVGGSHHGCWGGGDRSCGEWNAGIGQGRRAMPDITKLEQVGQDDFQPHISIIIWAKSGKNLLMRHLLMRHLK